MKNPKTIADSIGHWLNHEYLCKQSFLFSEKYLVVPISQYLKSRYSDKLRVEYPHPILKESKSQRGDVPRVDYMILGGNRENIKKYEFAMETKWISNRQKNINYIGIIRDIVRLELIVHQYNASGYFLIAGNTNKINSLRKTNDYKYLQIFDNKPITLKLKQKDSGLFAKKILQSIAKYNNVDIANSIMLKNLHTSNSDSDRVSVFCWRIKKKNIGRFNSITQL